MKIDPQLRQELKDYLQKKLEHEKSRVQIVSAYTLTEHEMNMIHSHFPFLKGADTENVVDKSIVAGVVIKFGTKMIDLSLKTKLISLQQHLYDIT